MTDDHNKSTTPAGSGDLMPSVKSTRSTDPILRVKDLTKSLSGTVIVREISFDLYPGDFFGLIGANGSGKTTLMRCVTGLLTTPPGTIELGGFDLATDPIEAKFQFGLAVEPNQLPRGLTGREFLELWAGAKNCQDWWDETESIADLLQITDRLDEDVAHYSLGMKQKVSLLAAFLDRPAVLLLDESLSALDPISAFRTKKFLEERARDGAAVFLASHHLESIEKYCTRIGMLHEGRLLRLWTREELRGEMEERGEDLEDIFVRLVGESAP